MDHERFVAVTQRVVEISSYGEVRDCLDQSWTSWLASCGFTAVPVPNRLGDVASFLDALDVAGVILTGGNNLALDVYDVDGPVDDTHETRDRTEFSILEHAARMNLPVIGVCRGMQVLHAFTGGRLRRVEDRAPGDASPRHVATFHDVALASRQWRALAGSSTVEVNSFHDFGFHADSVSGDWEVAATTESDGVVEGLVHRNLPFIGMGWHPERDNRAPGFDRSLVGSMFDDAHEHARVGDGET